MDELNEKTEIGEKYNQLFERSFAAKRSNIVAGGKSEDKKSTFLKKEKQ